MKKSILALLIIFVLIIPVFTGCEDNKTGLTKEERVKAFIQDINNPLKRIGIHKNHFVPPLSDQEDAITLTVFNALGVTPLDYSIKSISSIDKIVTTTIGGGGGSDTKWVFTMKNEAKSGDDWYIMEYSSLALF